MVKWYILFALFCALAQGELNLEKPNFSQTREINTSRAVTFPFTNSIITATKNSTHMQINILKDDSNIMIPQCVTSLNALRIVIIGRLNAATSDDTVMIWGETGNDKAEKDKRKRFGGIQVKPWKNCEEILMEIASYKLPEDYLSLKPVILSNKGSFQVFHPQQQDCPVCQFDEKDHPSVPADGETEGKPSKNFLIKAVRLPNGDDGYFYAYNYENNTAVIRYLDVNRTVLKEKYVDYPVDVVDSVKNQPLVNICSEKGVSEIYCGQLDDTLEFRFKERLPLLDEHIVMSLTVSSGPKGVLLAGTLQTQLEKPQKYVVYSFDAKGKMIKTMDFGELDESSVGDLYRWYSEEGGRYCLQMHETKYLGDLDAREVIKCIDPK